MRCPQAEFLLQFHVKLHVKILILHWKLGIFYPLLLFFIKRYDINLFEFGESDVEDNPESIIDE